MSPLEMTRNYQFLGWGMWWAPKIWFHKWWQPLSRAALHHFPVLGPFSPSSH